MEQIFQMPEALQPKYSDDKKYLVLLTVYPETDDNLSEFTRDWSIKTGRQNTYDFLKEMVKAEIVDPISSFIIAGSVEKISLIENFKPDSNPISVYRFMKVMYDNHKIIDDEEDFSIDDYLPSDYNNGDKSILDI